MSEYTRHEWKDGEVITPDRMNNIEAGITEAKKEAEGKAPTSHGNHVPTTETADNARFLRNDNTWQKVTPANIGAAPSGFGLGTSAVLASDVDTTVKNGFYRTTAVTQNKPFDENGWFITSNRTEDDCIEQIYFTYEGHYILIRKRNAAKYWDEWEWVNPPMQVGVEYRTTKRRKGEAVYTKLIDMEAIPVTGEKSKPVANDATEIVEIKGIAYHYSNQGQVFPLPLIDGQTTFVSISVVKDSGFEVVIKSNGNLPDAYFYAQVVVEYTK